MGPPKKHRKNAEGRRSQLQVSQVIFGKSLASSSLWFCTLVVWRFSLNFWFRWTKCPWSHIFQFNFATRKAEPKFWSIYCKLLLKTVLEIASFRCKYVFSDQLFGFSEHGTSVFSKDRISFSARRILSSNSSPFRCSSSFSWAAWNIEQICWWADSMNNLKSQVPCEDS